MLVHWSIAKCCVVGSINCRGVLLVKCSTVQCNAVDYSAVQ